MESYGFCRAYQIGAGDKVFATESAPEIYPRDRTFHLRHVRLDITLDQEKTEVRGTATLTLSPLNDGLREIELDAERMHIRRVSDGDGRALDFEYGADKLKVRLGRAYKAGAEFSLKIAYDARPKKGMRDDNFRTKIGAISGLAAMGDPKALPELEKVRD